MILTMIVLYSDEVGDVDDGDDGTDGDEHDDKRDIFLLQATLNTIFYSRGGNKEEIEEKSDF